MTFQHNIMYAVEKVCLHKQCYLKRLQNVVFPVAAKIWIYLPRNSLIDKNMFANYYANSKKWELFRFYQPNNTKKVVT